MKMTWQDFDPHAQHAVQMFNLILEAYEWEDEAQTEARLDQGQAVYPHATRGTSNFSCQLQAAMHTQVRMLSLHLTPHESHQPGIKLHFLYLDDPTHVLEQIVEAQHWLQPGLYFRFAMQLTNLCEDILIETANQEIHTLRA